MATTDFAYGEPPKKKKRWLLKTVLFLFVLVPVVFVGAAYVYVKVFRVLPQDVCGDVEASRRDQVCTNMDIEWVKYGSLESEWDRGIPYPLFSILPRVFADLLPGPGGFRALGIPWEEGRELPVGFSKKTMGFERVTQNCAVCHAATYRTRPDETPVVVPTGPSHTTNVMGFLDFLEAAVKDPRWTPDILIPEIARNFDIGWDDRLIYRFAIIPIAKQRVLEQAADFAWMHAEGRPAWGPGRDGPFNLTKFNLVGLEDDGTVDNADFPSIWNMSIREGQSLNWAGETQDPLAVFIDSALGLGAPPKRVTALMEKMRDILRNTPPPKYPFPVDAAKAEAGKPLFAEYCGSCHAEGGKLYGRANPIDEIGTDRERYDTWTARDAELTNAKADEIGVSRKAMVKDVGYVSQPLDGIWLRAPYLHNGAVPSLRALLEAPENRPDLFWRGCDLYDPADVGFVSTGQSDACPRVFRFDTAERGNGKGGHVYGTDMTAEEKDALLEYMKTL